MRLTTYSVRGNLFTLLGIGANAVVFDAGGEPVAYLTGAADLSAATLFVSAPFHSRKEKLAVAVPELKKAVATAVTVRPSEVAAVLLFRDRESNGKLHSALSRMPFGAAANFELGEGGGGMNLEDIAGNVERLRAVLAEHARDDEARAAELQTHRQAVEGVAALLRLAGVKGCSLT
jgi:hypothetical protein